MSTRSLTLAGVICVTAACSGQANGPQTVGPEVNVITLQPQRIMLTTEVPGHTAAFAWAQVRPQVTGTILRRQFEEGADVRAGQVLYEIDPMPYRVAFNSAKAGLLLAEALAARLRARQVPEGVRDQALLVPPPANASPLAEIQGYVSLKTSGLTLNVRLSNTRVRR